MLWKFAEMQLSPSSLAMMEKREMPLKEAGHSGSPGSQGRGIHTSAPLLR